MPTSLWLNLPVRDLAASRTFFKALGFTFNDKHGQPALVCMALGQPPVYVNLFPAAAFASMAGAPVADTRGSAETMVSLGAASRAEVDEITARARAAGAHVFGEPAEVQGWMYGSGFTDLDGHRWNILYMDMARLPKG